MSQPNEVDARAEAIEILKKENPHITFEEVEEILREEDDYYV